MPSYQDTDREDDLGIQLKCDYYIILHKAKSFNHRHLSILTANYMYSCFLSVRVNGHNW